MRPARHHTIPPVQQQCGLQSELGRGRVPRVKSLSWQARGGWARRAGRGGRVRPGWAGESGKGRGAARPGWAGEIDKEAPPGGARGKVLSVPLMVLERPD